MQFLFKGVLAGLSCHVAVWQLLVSYVQNQPELNAQVAHIGKKKDSKHMRHLML